MTAAEVLRRYQEELLPEFIDVALADVNQVGRFGNPPLSVAAVRGSVEVHRNHTQSPLGIISNY